MWKSVNILNLFDPIFYLVFSHSICCSYPGLLSALWTHQDLSWLRTFVLALLSKIHLPQKYIWFTLTLVLGVFQVSPWPFYFKYIPHYSCASYSFSSVSISPAINILYIIHSSKIFFIIWLSPLECKLH